ncbi:MAG: hypothetical protein H6985_04305 [Pseudomonadales bacterium]|nr:hypothetical protein [Halioglobus sp.]MCP5128790.1 hypothetical protein [Pseudomonadales bacterium]
MTFDDTVRRIAIRQRGRAVPIRSGGRASPSAVELRPATSDELVRAFRLMQSNMRESMTEANMEWDQDWTERNYRSKSNYSIFLQSDWKGFLSIEYIRSVLYIHTLQLTAQSQGRIFGASVFDWLLGQASANGATSIECKAFRSSPVLRLYQKLGFRIVGEDKALVSLALALGGGR